MKQLTRRDFIKSSAAISGAMALSASGLIGIKEALSGGPGSPPVVWLQGQGCTGCSVSLLNTVYYATIDDLLINTLDMKFHPNVMAAAGDLAANAAITTNNAGGYILIVEGSIPTGAEAECCHIWEGTTILDAFQAFAPNAAKIIAVGTCASYGGLSAGSPNPTNAMGLEDSLDYLGLGNLKSKLINIPGCPSHPDWIVGTVSLLLNGQEPSLDREGRPEDFFGSSVHNTCPNRGTSKAKKLSDPGCLMGLGCQGQKTNSDCALRKWNSGGAGQAGVNWCIGSRNPCQGCTEPAFPDGMSPFYTLGGGPPKGKK